MQINCHTRSFANIEGIIFDKDGTLEDSGNYLRSLAHQRARIIDAQIPGIGEPLLMAFGVDRDKLDPAGLQAIGSRMENTIAAAAYIAETGRGWAESMNIATKCFVDADRGMQEGAGALFPGVSTHLKSLAAAGLKLGIVSAATTASVNRFAAGNQLTHIFTSLLGSDGQFAKPDPQLFIQACQQMGVSPDRMLMVGDGVWDMVMAKKAGAAGCIGINWINPTANLTGSDLTINTIEQLKVES